MSEQWWPVYLLYLQKQDTAWHGADAQQTPVSSEEHKVIGPWGKNESDTKFYQVYHVASVSKNHKPGVFSREEYCRELT